MEYRTVIVDELGTVIRFCSDYTEEENEALLAQCEEYHIITLAIE